MPYVPLLTFTDDGSITTIVVDHIIRWYVPKTRDKTTLYLKNSDVLTLDGDFSKQLIALYYPPTA